MKYEVLVAVGEARGDEARALGRFYIWHRGQTIERSATARSEHYCCCAEHLIETHQRVPRTQQGTLHRAEKRSSCFGALVASEREAALQPDKLSA